MALEKKTTKAVADSASFRDNFGFVYWQGPKLLRQINPAGQAAYDGLMSSGLYKALTEQGWLVPHREVSERPTGAYKVIEPELVPFISYPYEWSYSQLRDAALATIEIQKLALKHGQTLRDASAYNIQFFGGKPLMIDTLSFEPYQAGQPWVAYRQFCQHFLAPLALASHSDINLLQLLRVHIDGIPLALAAKLLPGRTRFSAGLYMHIKLHGRFQDRYSSGNPTSQSQRQVSQTALLGVLDSLERTIKKLPAPKLKTEWGGYYEDTNYSEDAFAAKQAQVQSLIERVGPKRVLDLGANDGTFSRLAAMADFIISADIDPAAVEHNYASVKRKQETNLLPLLIDLTNPSPNLGWAEAERKGFTVRAKSDLALALALVHHLAISNNLPLTLISSYFAKLAPNLIIEFVPKSDSQVQRLLAAREDIFPNYTKAGFEAAFANDWEIVKALPVQDSDRILYLMRQRHV